MELNGSFFIQSKMMYLEYFQVLLVVKQIILNIAIVIGIYRQPLNKK